MRLNAAVGFARRGEAVAAPALLNFMRAQTLDASRWTAKFAIEPLVGEKLDYLEGGVVASPAETARRDAAAFARVEAWIANHPAN